MTRRKKNNSFFFFHFSHVSKKNELTGKVVNVASVNAIGPGLFETGMTENTLFKSEEFLNAYNMLNPSNRPGRKGEVNGTVLYLSSDIFKVNLL